MNVTALTSLYKPHTGGVETMVSEMGQMLKGRGHSMNVITKVWPESLPEIENIDGININRVRTGRSDEELLEIARHLRDRFGLLDETDLLHIVGMRRPLPLFGVMLARANNIPILGNVVGSEIPNPNSPDSYSLWQQGLHYMPDAYHNVDQLIAVSDSTKTLTQMALPSLSDEIVVLPVGIDLARYEALPPVTPTNTERFILALRRLEKSKGIDVLIRAYAQLVLNSELADTQLVIAGDGPERENLESLVKSLGLDEEMVRFIGTVSIEQGIGMLKTAVMTVVPSRDEGGGLVNTTANAVGCALIASDIGGIREYTTDRAAILVPQGNPSILATAIKQVSSNPELRDKLIRNGKIFAGSMDWQIIIDRYLNMYEKVSAGPQKQLKLELPLSRKIIKILSNEA